VEFPDGPLFSVVSHRSDCASVESLPLAISLSFLPRLRNILPGNLVNNPAGNLLAAELTFFSVLSMTMVDDGTVPRMGRDGHLHLPP